MKLSIITINLNNASGIRKTIESVISQTVRNFEYIIIDGCSGDGSTDVIREYQDNIDICISEPDNGLFSAMNKGIRLAKGEYLQFLNSGDWLVSNYVIGKMLDALPDCSVFYGNMFKILPGGKVLRDKGEAGNISLFTFIGGTLNHSPAFIKKSLFEKYGYYDETLKIVSDWKFYLIAAGIHNEPVAYIDLDVAWFDMTGISNTNTTLLEEERASVLNSLFPKSVLKLFYELTYEIQIIKRIKKNKIFWPFIQFIFRSLTMADRVIQKYSSTFQNHLYHK